VAALIRQTLATNVPAALLTDITRFQQVWTSMAEQHAWSQRFQQKLWSSALPLIELRRQEEQERRQTLAVPFQAIDARWIDPRLQEAAFREEFQTSLDIGVVMDAYCPLYQERHSARQQDDQLSAALTRLIAQLRPGLRNPRAARALRQRAAVEHTSPQALLRTKIFPEAIVLVSCEAATPQRMRVGRQWATDRHGKVQAASPVQGLPMRAFERWWFSQVYAAATAILLDEAYPRPTTQSVPLLLREEDALERLVLPESPGAHDSATLTALLYDAKGDDPLHHLLTIASPRARELLLLLQQGLSRNKAAQVMGISRSTVDVVLCRLRKKVHRR